MDNVADYDDDIIAWSERQAALLRALAGSVQGLPNDLDLLNIAEEIEDVGRNIVRSARSFLTLILVHVIKAASVTNSQARGHWQAEVTTFHRQFLDELTPSLHRHIDIAQQWRLAIKEARDHLQAHGDRIASDIPTLVPFGLDEFTAQDFDFDAAVARLTATRQNSAA